MRFVAVGGRLSAAVAAKANRAEGRSRSIMCRSSVFVCVYRKV